MPAPGALSDRDRIKSIGSGAIETHHGRRPVPCARLVHCVGRCMLGQHLVGMTPLRRCGVVVSGRADEGMQELDAARPHSNQTCTLRRLKVRKREVLGAKSGAEHLSMGRRARGRDDEEGPTGRFGEGVNRAREQLPGRGRRVREGQHARELPAVQLSDASTKRERVPARRRLQGLRYRGRGNDPSQILDHPGTRRGVEAAEGQDRKPRPLERRWVEATSNDHRHPLVPEAAANEPDGIEGRRVEPLGVVHEHKRGSFRGGGGQRLERAHETVNRSSASLGLPARASRSAGGRADEDTAP